jgi:hypothetical protein
VEDAALDAERITPCAESAALAAGWTTREETDEPVGGVIGAPPSPA